MIHGGFRPPAGARRRQAVRDRLDPRPDARRARGREPTWRLASPLEGCSSAGAWSAGGEWRDVHRRVARDGRGDRRGAAGRTREDAQRAIDAANDAANGWARLTAFERAALMHRVGDEIEKRRDAARARRSRSTRASRCTSRATRSRSSSPTGGTPPRTASGSRDGSQTRSRRGSASCSSAVRAA